MRPLDVAGTGPSHLAMRPALRRLAMAASFGLGGIVTTLLLAGGAVCLTSGCSTVGYYASSVTGHLNLVGAARPVSSWLADPATPEPLRQRLMLAQRMRDFAVNELGEPDNASYRRYADLHRPAAVWNVVAAPELSLRLQTWCFAVVGCVAYRGYYDPAAAEREAAALRERGLEVAVYPVPAYSTLGKLPGDWLADPLLNTFIDWSEAELARLIFHELAHQVAFAPGDTEFNESFATAVERIGSARWLARNGSETVLAENRGRELRRERFRALTGAYRDSLQALYTSDLSVDAKRRRKLLLYATLRADYANLRATSDGYRGYDEWFARANNASFGVLAAYNGLAPQFER
ncbi:MAG: aminopeptidase, partial [Pseudomonadota bacterium]|nr:aminopeptidase [Pseudomonadota bacterium]